MSQKRLLPTSEHAERVTLGAILLDSSYYLKVVNRLEVEDFSLDSHRQIFARMVELAESDSAIDLVTLAESLERNRELDGIGGMAYLCGLTEGIPFRPALRDYLKILREKRRLREVISACSEAISSAYDATASGEIKERLWEALGNGEHGRSDVGTAPEGLPTQV